MADAAHIDALMREAFASHEAGRVDEAEGLYRAILEQDPESIDANYLLGEILCTTGRNERALGLLRKAISLEATVAAFHHTLGCALQACGKAAEAAESFRNSLRLEPRNPETLNSLGALLLHDGAVDRARACFEDAVSVAPGYVAAHFNLGEALRAQEQWEGAERCYRAVQPATQESLARLAEVIGRQGNYDALPAVYRDLVRLRLSAGKSAGPGTGDAGRIRIPNTTLCCVDCSYHDLALHALRHSMERCSFERVLFLTDRDFDVEGVEVVRIPRIGSLEEYSNFMLKGLDAHIGTAFALVVQYDGYVLDGRQWTDAFFDFDYIGARWPGPGADRVGNGGFSLRSKRLLTALQDARCPPSSPEDAAICIRHRSLLEREFGIRFAPAPVADRFSFEGVPRTSGTFGFHGAGHFAAIAGKSDSEVANYRGEDTRLIGQR